MFIACAQKSNGSPLSSKRGSFIIMIVYHPLSIRPFFLCMYNAAYLRAMLLFLQKVLSLIDINSPLLSAKRVFNEHLDLFSTRDSHI